MTAITLRKVHEAAARLNTSGLGLDTPGPSDSAACPPATTADSIGGTVWAFPGSPAGFLDEAVVGAARQGEVVDVGLAVVLPVRDRVMDLALVARGGAAWPVQPRSRA